MSVIEPHRDETHAAREQGFRNLAENSPNIIIRYDLDCRRVYVNPAFSYQSGISIEQALNAKPDMQWHTHVYMLNMDAQEYQNRIKHVMQSGNEDRFTVAWHRLTDGEYVAHEMHVVIEQDTYGNTIGALAIGHDITEQKKKEELLHANEQQFRTLVENSPDIIVRYNHNLKRVYVNAAWERANGISATDVIGKSPLEKSVFIAPVAKELEEILREVFESGQNTQIDLSWQDMEGKTVSFNLHAVVEYDQNGNPNGILTVARDITERKRLETQMKKNEESLKEAQKIAKIGSWELEFSTKSLIWSDEMYRILEIEQNNQCPLYAEFLNAVHPEDREITDALYRESVNDKTPYEVQHRVLMSDGRIKYVHERAETYYDTQGNPLRSIGTAQDVTEQKIAENKIAFLAQHDALTGLPNRTVAKDRTEQAIAYAIRNSSKTALLFIDLDEFKSINDSLGHSVGDTMLKIVASRLEECVRATDTISRQGGDEFLVILSDVSTLDDVTSITKKIIQAFEKPFYINSHSLSISASIGIALYPDCGDTFELLLKNADTAMYKAKEAGKNTHCFYSHEMNHNLLGQCKIQNDLKIALKNNEFILHYQPQIDLAEGCISGAEALIRWQHPQLGMILPMSFISIAESSGLIVQIGEWVITEACRQAVLWHNEGIKITIAVNISAVQFKRGNLETVVKQALDSSGLNPRFLELELTESILINDIENILQTVRNLKELGIQLSIDDFGTGYSSLSYLKRFAVDKLKIDQSFIRDILSNQEDAVIVKTIIQMAKNLNLKTIAEGVENEQVLALINSYGCDEVQGYHFAKPMEATEFENYYNQKHHNQRNLLCLEKQSVSLS